jgi:hypothetical protein
MIWREPVGVIPHRYVKKLVFFKTGQGLLPLRNPLRAASFGQGVVPFSGVYTHSRQGSPGIGDRVPQSCTPRPSLKMAFCSNSHRPANVFQNKLNRNFCAFACHTLTHVAIYANTLDSEKTTSRDLSRIANCFGIATSNGSAQKPHCLA